MVFTATKARKDQPGAISMEPVKASDSCCTPDVFGIIMSIFMQDGPFLVLRLLLIIKYNVLSYTNMFFTCKNTLVCMLLLYRFVVIQLQRYHLLKQTEEGDTITMVESNSRSKLILSCNSTDQYYNYSTKVILKESEIDPNDVDITYVLKRHMSIQPDAADSIDDVRTLYASDAGVLLPAEVEALSGDMELAAHHGRTRKEGDAETFLSYGGASGDAVRIAMMGHHDSEGVDMERLMTGSRVYSVESGSENSVEKSMNIVKSRFKSKKKEGGITLSSALTKSLKLMNSAFGLGISNQVGNSIGNNSTHKTNVNKTPSINIERVG